MPKTKTKTTKTKKTVKRPKVSVKRKKRVSQAEFDSLVEKLAYDLFQQTGAAHGDDWSHWLNAEKSIKKEYSVKK